MVLLAALALLGWWKSRPVPPYHLPALVGTRTLRSPLALELIIDQSGSNAHTDPHGLRVIESAEVLRWLGRYGGPSDRVGVVQFSGSPVTTLPLTPVHDAAAVAASATAPDPTIAGGGTDIASAIGLGVANLANAPQGSRRMIVLFTDGASDRSDAVASVLAHTGGVAVFMVALDADNTFGRSRAFWSSLPLQGLTRIHSARRGAVAKPIAAAIAHELGQRLG
jgi:hypothetical protein